jgi:flavin reductase (DIM6/NTAB) family NADH-FMN oxidoreductase RutF
MYSWTLITGDSPVTTDALSFRQSLGSFPTGVCMVTTVTPDGKREGMTINSFASVSLDPPLILWSIRDDARSAEAFIGGRHFILSVLAASQRELAQHFARSAPDKSQRCHLRVRDLFTPPGRRSYDPSRPRRATLAHPGGTNPAAHGRDGIAVGSCRETQ